MSSKGPSSVYTASEHLLKRIMLEYLRDQDVTVVIFGSRARGDATAQSDIDIAVLPKNGWDKTQLTLLREKVENANIPYKVEIVDLSDVSEEFRTHVLKEGMVWKK